MANMPKDHKADVADEENKALSSNPRDTDHSTGSQDAAENADKESPS